MGHQLKPTGTTNKQRLIRVHAYVKDGKLIIDESDNGIGIPPQVAAQLLAQSRPDVRSKGSGIGVRNVHQRIALSFGAQYGLSIYSEPDEGTLVRITLPILTDPIEEEDA